jgi:hypothetical protein
MKTSVPNSWIGRWRRKKTGAAPAKPPAFTQFDVLWQNTPPSRIITVGNSSIGQATAPLTSGKIK